MPVGSFPAGGLKKQSRWNSFEALLELLCVIFYVQKPVTLAALLICMLVNYLVGPLRSKQCHVKDTGIFKKNQIMTFVIIFIYLICLYLLPSSYTLATGFWIIIAHSAQLIVAKCMYYFTERRNTNEETDTKISQTA